MKTLSFKEVKLEDLNVWDMIGYGLGAGALAGGQSLYLHDFSCGELYFENVIKR